MNKETVITDLILQNHLKKNERSYIFIYFEIIHIYQFRKNDKGYPLWFNSKNPTKLDIIG